MLSISWKAVDQFRMFGVYICIIDLTCLDLLLRQWNR